MVKEKVTLIENIDVFIMSDGRKATIEKYIDIKLTDGVALRVCLVRIKKTGEQELYLDKQLVAAYEKHDNDVIHSFNISYFYDNSNKGEEDKIIGEGNLLPKLLDIIHNVKETKNVVNKVMILVQRGLSVQI